MKLRTPAAASRLVSSGVHCWVCVCCYPPSLVHQLRFPEGGSSHSIGDVTPATTAETGLVPVSDAYGSNLHHAVLSKTF